MTRRTKILALVLLSITAAFLCSLPFLAEPRAQGQSLSTWLGIAMIENQAFKNQRPNLTAEAATNAIRQLGDKAVPTLLRKLQAKDPAWKFAVFRWLKRNGWGRPKLIWSNHYQDEALTGFRILGSDARTAIPKLTELLMQTNATRNAADALAMIGPVAAPVLRDAFTNSNPEIRRAAISAVCFNRKLAATMLDDLWPRLQDTNQMVADTLLIHLGHIVPSERSLPVLTNALYNQRQRSAALTGLMLMGTNARSATAHLLPLLEEDSATLNRHVMATLRRTDPATAARISTTNINAGGTEKN